MQHVVYEGLLGDIYIAHCHLLIRGRKAGSLSDVLTSIGLVLGSSPRPPLLKQLNVLLAAWAFCPVQTGFPPSLP
jgi:energy-converting hydrogenase Eha subunit E